MEPNQTLSTDAIAGRKMVGKNVIFKRILLIH